MSENDDEVVQKLQAIKERYASKMPAKIDELEKALQNYQSTASDSKEIYPLVHTLAGSAKTFGFDSVSEAAGKAELLLGPEAQKEQAIPEIENLLKIMKAAI